MVGERMPVSTTDGSASLLLLSRTAEAEISGRLARAMDASMDDGGSFMIGYGVCVGFQ